MDGKGGTDQRARDGGDIKAWMKARNDHVRGLRKNATRSGRAPSGSASSAGPLHDPRIPAGDLAHAEGLAAGAVRGAVHLIEGMAHSAMVAEQILDPVYRTLHPGSPAALTLAKAAVRTLHAGRAIARHPAEPFHRANLALNPAASPMAPTVAGEARRRFDIGQNQGELGFDVVAGMAAPEALAARALPAEQQVAWWMARGLTEPQARYMAEPYVGMGHHYYPRGAKLPKAIGGVALPKSLAGRPMPLPKALGDSEFNVLKPPGISRGDFYEKHVAVDSNYRGGRFPAHVGGTWSRTKLGLKVHGPVGRIVHGAPPALKRTVGGAGGGLGGAVAAARGDDRR